MDTHPYRARPARHATLTQARRWSEIDAELVIACVSSIFVVAALAGHCDRTGATLGGLGLVASLAAIIGWLRRGPTDQD